MKERTKERTKEREYVSETTIKGVTHLYGTPEEEEKKNRWIVEATVTENSPKSTSDTKSQIQKAQRTPHRKNAKKKYT